MTARRYSTPPAFKQALERRLRNASDSGVDFARRRQLLVFDRVLARLGHVLGESVVLKGGLVIELRLARARTTKDIDLRMSGSPEEILDSLQEAGRLDLGDFMRFEVRPDRQHPEIEGEGMRYDGYRFRAECRLAGKLYGRPFGIDVGFGDPLTQEPDVVVAEDVLDFAGIEPPTLRLYPVVSHLAEKLHAYTLPRPRPNTRVKDLPDLALLGCTGPLDAEALRNALERTFGFRDTHSLPQSLARPPAFWEKPYAAMAEADDLPWRTLGDIYGAVAAFLDPVLGDAPVRGEWDPAAWQWRD